MRIDFGFRSEGAYVVVCVGVSFVLMLLSGATKFVWFGFSKKGQQFRFHGCDVDLFLSERATFTFSCVEEDGWVTKQTAGMYLG